MARRHRILALSAIAAAGFALSVLFSSVISRRTANGGLRRQMLVQLDAFQDPKTVHLRPNMEGLLRSDVPPMPLDMNGAPIGGAANEMPLEMPAAGGALWNAPNSIGNVAMQPPPSMVQAEADAPPIPMPVDGAQPIFNNNNNAPIPMESSVEQPPAEDAGVRTTYNIDHALATVQAFRYTLFFFVYDASSDSFVVVHNIRGCDHGCNRIHRVAAVVSHALRKNFPGRFTQEKGDWVVMMSTGDAPRIKAPCLSAANDYCHSVDFAPILNFGSVFVNQNFLPSMVAMPLPVRPHIPCFEEWQSGGMEANRVCQDLQPKLDFGDNDVKTGLVFGKELGMLQSDNYWDDLVPQIIWRGTDFVFLHTMFHEMRAPEYKLDLKPKESTKPRNGSPDDEKRWAIQTLWEMGDDKLLPRWRGVLLTSEAELDAKAHEALIGEPKIPWINVKFASINRGGIKVAASENPEYQTLEKLGIACIGEHVNMTQQARFKYHIDLGGGGGTTWTGTIEKLALPGVLFHHVTPTKDWFHDLLVPWTHYIPVKTDLSDLREQFEWAEEHPIEARKIAEAGTEFARWMGSAEGFAKLYEEYLVAPLQEVIRGYRPLPLNYQGKSVMDVINEVGEKEGFSIVGRCSGLHANSCEQLV